jgi:hypothetical protein
VGKAGLERIATENNFHGMGVIEILREFNHAIPFEPYEIKMVSGERYHVLHPDFVAIPKGGSYVFVVDHNERPHHLNPILIERASAIRAHAKRRRRAA